MTPVEILNQSEPLLDSTKKAAPLSEACVICRSDVGLVVPMPTRPVNASTIKLGLEVPTNNPPANVLVAVVEVALIDATCGVEVETTFPFASVESSILAPTLFKSRIEPAARVSVVPESKVRVPEVKLSEVSERRNWDEVNPPRVEESFPTQFPVESSKHPAVSLRPLLNVEVAPEVRRILPPVIVRPDEVAVSPEAWKPLYRVEVAPATKLPTL